MQCQRLWNHWCNPSVKWLIRLLCVGSSLISSVGGQSCLGSFGAAETGFLAADYQNCFHIHSEDDTPSFQSNVQHKGLLSEYICMSSPSFMFPVNPQPQTENRENCTDEPLALPNEMSLCESHSLRLFAPRNLTEFSNLAFDCHPALLAIFLGLGWTTV